MRFSLKTLSLATATIPPIAWLAWVMLWRPSDPDRPLELPDPIGLLGIVAWITIYLSFVHKRLPNF